MTALPPVPSLRRQRSLALSLQIVALLLLALHLYVRTLPATPAPIPTPEDAESAWWGLWPVKLVPSVFVWAGALLVLLALAWGAWSVLSAPQARTQMPAPGSLRWRPFLVLASLLLVGAFFLFPLAHTRWGDAYMISKGMAWPDPALRLTHSWQAPLDVYLHSRLWLWLGPPRGWEDAAPVYRILSPLAGALYLAAAVGIATERHEASAWLPWGLLATLGLIQLFFGYVENYSFAAAFVLIYLWLALRALEGRTPLWVVASLLALTHALHPSTIVLAPSLLAAGWLVLRRGAGGNKGGPGHVYSVAAQIVLPMLVVGAATFLWMELAGHGISALMASDRPGGSDARWLVPLWAVQTRWEHYTMFSWAHLRDFLNEQMLVAPVVLPSLLLGLAASAGVRKQPADRPALVFLWVAAIGYLLFTLVWNPDYGGQRDWDLFSLAALPLTVLAAGVIRAALPERRLLVAGMAPLILFQALHTAAWVYSNTLPWEWPA